MPIILNIFNKKAPFGWTAIASFFLTCPDVQRTCPKKQEKQSNYYLYASLNKGRLFIISLYY